MRKLSTEEQDRIKLIKDFERGAIIKRIDGDSTFNCFNLEDLFYQGKYTKVILFETDDFHQVYYPDEIIYIVSKENGLTKTIAEKITKSSNFMYFKDKKMADIYHERFQSQKDEIDLSKINKTSKIIHQANCEKGFYDETRETGTLLMLIVSEISEALEADRKNRFAKIEKFEADEDMQCFLDLEKMGDLGDDFFKENFEKYIKDTYEDEIADTFIRLLDHVGYLGIDIEKHIKLKLKYNSLRPKKHGKEY